MNQAMQLQIAITAQNQAQASFNALQQNLIQAQAAGQLTAQGFQMLTRGMAAAQQQASTWGRVVSSLTPQTASLMQATQQATTAMQRMGQVAGTANSAFRDMAGALVAVGAASKALSLVNQGLDAIKSSFIGTNAQLEQLRIGFTTMLGSASQGAGYLASLREFAIKTPFEFKDLAGAAQRMMGMGFAASQVMPMLTSVGNAVAAVGGSKATLDGVILALGQIQTKGRVMAQEMNQLAERGIPAWRIISEELGVSTAKAMKMGEAGEISAERFIQAFQRFVSANFGEMMDKQSKTFTFAISNIKEAIDMLIADGTLPLYNQIRDLAVAVQELLISSDFRAWVSGLSGAMTQATKSITDDLKTINQAGAGPGGLLDGLGRTFVALGGGIDWVARVTGVFVSNFSESIQGWSKIAAAAVHNVILSFETLGKAIQLITSGQGDKIPQMMAEQTAKMKIAGDAMIAGMRQIERSGSGLWGALGKAAEDARRDFAPFLNMTPGVAEALDKIALSVVEIGQSMDKGVMKIAEFREELGEFADAEREINDKRSNSIAKTNESLAESYASAIKSMRRHMEDWAEDEGQISKRRAERLFDIDADLERETKDKAARLREIDRALMVGQERSMYEAIKAEQAKLQHEIQVANEAAAKKRAVVEAETAEQMAALDKRKRRAIEDHNESVMRDYNRAVYAINTANAEAANAMAKSNEKKQKIIDNLNAEQQKVIELQKQYDDLNARRLGGGVWIQDDATGVALPGAGVAVKQNLPPVGQSVFGRTREDALRGLGSSNVQITGPITIQTSGEGEKTLEAFVAELERRGLSVTVGNQP